MTKRTRNLFLSRAFQRSLTAMARSALRAGTQAVAQAARTQSVKQRPAAPTKTQRVGAVAEHGRAGVAIGPTGTRRFQLFKPVGVGRQERLPLLVMLPHALGIVGNGCADWAGRTCVCFSIHSCLRRWQ